MHCCWQLDCVADLNQSYWFKPRLLPCNGWLLVTTNLMYDATPLMYIIRQSSGVQGTCIVMFTVPIRHVHAPILFLRTASTTSCRVQSKLVYIYTEPTTWTTITYLFIILMWKQRYTRIHILLHWESENLILGLIDKLISFGIDSFIWRRSFACQPTHV